MMHIRSHLPPCSSALVLISAAFMLYFGLGKDQWHKQTFLAHSMFRSPAFEKQKTLRLCWIQCNVWIDQQPGLSVTSLLSLYSCSWYQVWLRFSSQWSFTWTFLNHRPIPEQVLCPNSPFLLVLLLGSLISYQNLLLGGLSLNKRTNRSPVFLLNVFICHSHLYDCRIETGFPIVLSYSSHGS